MSAEEFIVRGLAWLASATLFLLVGAGAYFLLATWFDRAQIARRMGLSLGATRGSRSERRISDGAAGIRSTVGSTMALLGRLMPLGEEDRQKICNAPAIALQTQLPPCSASNSPALCQDWCSASLP